MSRIDTETKRKLREMGAAAMLEALETQDETLVLGMAFEERLRLVVDDAHSGVQPRQGRRTDPAGRATLPERGPAPPRPRRRAWSGPDADRPARHLFVHRTAAERRLPRIHRIREVLPGVRAGQAGLPAPHPGALRPHARPRRSLGAGQGQTRGPTKFLNKYAAFTLLVIDEWLLDHPDEGMRSMLLELLERRYDAASTVFCTQYAKKDWHQRLGSGVHADAIMDRIVHNTIWVETGSHNMREHATMKQ